MGEGSYGEASGHNRARLKDETQETGYRQATTRQGVNRHEGLRRAGGNQVQAWGSADETQLGVIGDQTRGSETHRDTEGQGFKIKQETKEETITDRNSD